jgi:hypothetical protein
MNKNRISRLVKALALLAGVALTAIPATSRAGTYTALPTGFPLMLKVAGVMNACGDVAGFRWCLPVGQGGELLMSILIHARTANKQVSIGCVACSYAYQDNGWTTAVWRPDSGVNEMP